MIVFKTTFYKFVLCIRTSGLFCNKTLLGKYWKIAEVLWADNTGKMLLMIKLVFGLNNLYLYYINKKSQFGNLFFCVSDHNSGAQWPIGLLFWLVNWVWTTKMFFVWFFILIWGDWLIQGNISFQAKLGSYLENTVLKHPLILMQTFSFYNDMRLYQYNEDDFRFQFWFISSC